MRISLAQISSYKGEMTDNIEKHLQFIHSAIELNSKLVCFPELSITGYEPTLADELAVDVNNTQFDVFQTLSDDSGITICFGVPIRNKPKPKIGMIIIQPNTERKVYCKQYLHSDELPYFSEGDEQMIIEIDNKRIAPAICYESLLPEHFAIANKMEIDLYLTSVAKHESGTDLALQYFSNLSIQKKITVAMVNAVGNSDNFISDGRSSVWKNSVHQHLNNSEENLLTFEL